MKPWAVLLLMPALMAVDGPPGYFDYQSQRLEIIVRHVADIDDFCRDRFWNTWRRDRHSVVPIRSCSKFGDATTCTIFLPDGEPSDGELFRYERAICNGWVGDLIE